MKDLGFRLVLAAGAAALIASLSWARFRHTPGLPPRPPPPTASSGSAGELLKSTVASPAVWRNFLDTDARAAGISAPTVAQMSKVFVFRRDSARHVLSFKEPRLSVAGLALTLEHGERDTAVLAIENLTKSDVAYHVQSSASLGAGICNAAPLLATNVMVVGRGGSERRTMCVDRSDLTVAITTVESMELGPLSAWYVQQVNPTAVGLESRLSRAHRSEVASRCSPIVPQSVRSGLETGDLQWRDLIDFFARHRCETYQFPIEYRAFKKDGERPLPALSKTSL